MLDLVALLRVTCTVLDYSVLISSTVLLVTWFSNKKPYKFPEEPHKGMIYHHPTSFYANYSFYYTVHPLSRSSH